MIEIDNQCLTVIHWVEMKSIKESVEILSCSQILSFLLLKVFRLKVANER